MEQKKPRLNLANFVNKYLSNFLILATIAILDGVILSLQGLIYDLDILLEPA